MYCNECGNSLPDGVERCPVCGSKVKVQYANNGMNDFNNGQKNDPVQNQYQNDRMGYVNNNYGEDSSLSGIVLSENEQLVRQYHCSSVKQPRCRVCGSNNEDGSKFCWNCGNKLTEQSETRSSSVNQPGIQQNLGDVQHNQVGTPPKQVRMPQRQVPPGGFDWENGKKMAEERLQEGKNIADGCVGQLKRVAENQTITDKLKKISKKTWGIIGACVALVLVLLIVIALHKPTVNLNDYLKVTYMMILV